MKTIIQVLSIVLFLSSFMMAQRGEGPMGMGKRNPGAMKKIQELEKLKLIEVLNMNEETTIKFFARRTQHQNEIRDLENRLDNILDDMDAELKKDKDASQQKIKKLTEDFFDATNDIHKSKNEFLSSLKDILTPEQIGKLIVFDRNFREEMRQILMKQRMNRTNKQDQ